MGKTGRPRNEAAVPFRRERDTYRLHWDEPGHALHGLEIFAKPVRLGAYEALMVAWGRVQDDADITMQERAERIGHLRETFAKRLISWNYVDPDSDDGTILPCDASGLAELERDEFWAILGAYAETAAGVSGPLDESSDSGETSPVDLPPMDDL